MRQKIVPGGTIDTATSDEIAHAIAQAFSLRDVSEYQRFKGVIPLDGTGAGITDPTQGPRASAQYDLILQRVAIGGGSAAASALVLFYENQAVEADLLEVIQLGTGGRYSDSFANTLYLSANSRLVIVVSGGPANGSVSFNLQADVKRHAGRNPS